LPADSVKDWQKKAEEEFGIKKTQFSVHKKTLEEDQSFRKDPVTELLVAN
jgi:hypothetical protein